MSETLTKFEEEMAKIRADYTAFYSQFVDKEELTGKPVNSETPIRFVPKGHIYDPEWDEVFDDWYTEYLIYDFDWEY